ncbi:glycosyltransferase family 2 protein [Rubrivirga sp. IMCC43871]|uniref:glycosyltransferase family 2 protein n=1 Tax=Rubrivirga sp. IMCC43871 TaxID=3391575 RepID=UPI00398FD39C
MTLLASATPGALPPVSIGLPFYNAEAFLAGAIQSVFAQTHTDWELILVDDGSTDRSLEIARSVDDPRVRVYSDGTNRRLGARLNQIAGLARYELVARMDADDLMARNRIETQLRALAADPTADLVSTGVCSIRDDGTPVGIRCVPDGYRLSPASVLAGQGGIVHASVVARRAWVRRNAYDETLPIAEDANLWVRALAKDDLRVRFVSEPLYYYREDGNVTIEKQLANHRVIRGTIAHAASGFGWRDRALAYLSSLARSGAARALAATGQLDLLRSRRNVAALTDAEAAQHANEIAQILETNVPSSGGSLV